MTELNQNRQMIAWLESARGAIEKAQWQIVGVDSRASREERLRQSSAILSVAVSSIETARKMCDALATAEEASNADAHRS